MYPRHAAGGVFGASWRRLWLCAVAGVMSLWTVAACAQEGQEPGQLEPSEYLEALRRAAEQGDADAQFNLGLVYAQGFGVAKDYVQAYMWWNLAAAAGNEEAATNRGIIEARMTPEQIAEAQRLSRNWVPRSAGAAEDRPGGGERLVLGSLARRGSGFFVTGDGYSVTSHHVVAGARRIVVQTQGGTFTARLVRSDPGNDLAVLKVEGEFTALFVQGSRGLRVGDRVATMGFSQAQ